MKTLYEQNPDGVAALVDRYPNVTEMMRYFSSPTDMATALGFTGGGSAVNHWLRGANTPGNRSEKFARMWLEQHQKPKTDPVKAPAKVAPEPVSGGTILMVACPDALKDRVMKIMAMIGCDVVEV